EAVELPGHENGNATRPTSSGTPTLWYDYVRRHGTHAWQQFELPAAHETQRRLPGTPLDAHEQLPPAQKPTPAPAGSRPAARAGPLEASQPNWPGPNYTRPTVSEAAVP